mgnify:FL=1
MKINATLRCKETLFEPHEYEVDNVIEAPHNEFEYFKSHLLGEHDFIADYATYMKEKATAGYHCIILLDKDGNDGIIIDTQGTDYARYSAYFPNARQAVKSPLLEMPKEVYEYAKAITEEVDNIVKNALYNCENGCYSFPLSEINEELGHPQFDLELIQEMLFAREEFEFVDAAGGEIMLYPKEEYLNSTNKYDDEHYFDEACNDEIEILCAKHVLWIYSGDEGEKADLTDLKFVNIDFNGKNLIGAELGNVVMQNCNFRDAELVSAKAKGAKFINCDFTGLTAEEAEFVDCSFEKSKFQNSFFTHSNMKGAKFSDCEFNRSSFDSCLVKDISISNSDNTFPHSLPSMEGATDKEEEWFSEDVIETQGEQLS